MLLLKNHYLFPQRKIMMNLIIYVYYNEENKSLVTRLPYILLRNRRYKIVKFIYNKRSYYFTSTKA